MLFLKTDNTLTRHWPGAVFLVAVVRILMPSVSVSHAQNLLSAKDWAKIADCVEGDRLPYFPTVHQLETDKMARVFAVPYSLEGKTAAGLEMEVLDPAKVCTPNQLKAINRLEAELAAQFEAEQRRERAAQIEASWKAHREAV